MRQNKKLYLTEAGLFLKKRAEEILELNQKTEQELFNYQETILNGQIAIGCVEAENPICSHKSSKKWLLITPKCLLLFFSGTSNDILEKLDKGLLDVAILIDPATTDQYNRLTIA